jgi:hypothetical protein
MKRVFVPLLSTPVWFVTSPTCFPRRTSKSRLCKTSMPRSIAKARLWAMTAGSKHEQQGAQGGRVCSHGQCEALTKQQVSLARNRDIRLIRSSDYRASRPMPASLGQLLMTGVPGTELDSESAAAFKRIQPGAFILFGRNIQSAPQLRKLIDDLRELSEVEPIITIDQEGGRVSRLKLLGNEPPNANQLRDKGDLGLIARHGKITARLLRMFGFNMDLCPCSIFLRRRGGQFPAWPLLWQYCRAGGAECRAFNDVAREAGVLSCGKHFPGYSRCPSDAHHELPTVDVSLEDLEANELAVFRAFADRVDAMMIGSCLSILQSRRAPRPPPSPRQ